MSYSNIEDLINVHSQSETHITSFKSIVAKKNYFFQSLGESLLSVKWQKSENKQTGKFKRNLLLYESPEQKFF